MSFRKTVLNKLQEKDAYWFGCLWTDEFDYEYAGFDKEKWQDFRDKYFNNKIFTLAEDDNFVVLRFSFNNKPEMFVRVEGWENSLSGWTWDSVYEVTPEEVTKTRYRKI